MIIASVFQASKLSRDGTLAMHQIHTSKTSSNECQRFLHYMVWDGERGAWILVGRVSVVAETSRAKVWVIPVQDYCCFLALFFNACCLIPSCIILLTPATTGPLRPPMMNVACDRTTIVSDQ